MLTLLSLAVLVAAIVVAATVYRRTGSSRLDALVDKRRGAALVASRGELVDGNRHMRVAMALTPRTLFYENADLQASIEMEWVDEVEYDSRVGTGAAIPDGSVLRLRCYSQCFEFVLGAADAKLWAAALPAGRSRRDNGVPQLSVVGA